MVGIVFSINGRMAHGLRAVSMPEPLKIRQGQVIPDSLASVMAIFFIEGARAAMLNVP